MNKLQHTKQLEWLMECLSLVNIGAKENPRQKGFTEVLRIFKWNFNDQRHR